MKIVIDIPKEEYLKLIKTDENGEKEIPLALLMSLWDCVKYKCTPLPKNHGRLKDVDWIDDNCENHYSDKDGSLCYAWRDIDNAPTIIPADKAESEE